MAGGAKATLTSIGGGEGFDFRYFGINDRGDHHLGNPHCWGDLKWRLTVVDQDDANFAAIALIDGAGGVEHGDSVVEGEAAAGADLGFGVGGKFDGNACLDQGSGSGWQGDGFNGVEIHACIARMGVLGEDGGVAVAFDSEFHLPNSSIHLCWSFSKSEIV